MAYITPDTELQFFQNMNLDTDYENTIYFSSTQAKDAYFDALPSIKCPSCYYQREKRGYCRVEVPISQMIDRNYMRFKNKQFEGKWFYAFINDVEYINNITTQVNFTLDVMMTWMGTFTLDQCFVERNHTATDAIGDNIVPENIPIVNLVDGNTFYETSGTPSDLVASPKRSGVMGSEDTTTFVNTDADWQYLVVLTPSQTDQPSGNLLGIYSGYYYHMCADASALTSYLNGLQPLSIDRVQAIFYVPKFFDTFSNPSPTDPAPKGKSLVIPKPAVGHTDLNGYVPKNNKMYTYPYNFIKVFNTEGDESDYQFELFSGSICQFNIQGIIGEQTQIMCTPVNYRNRRTIITAPNVQNQMVMKNFPMCAWTADTFRAYLAQQLVAIPGAAIDLVTSGLIGDMMGVSPAVNSVRGVKMATGSLSEMTKGMYYKSQVPSEARGTNAPQLACAGPFPYKDFWFFRKCVRADEAKRIDDYFTMYGYAINEVRQPSINVRPYYTYVKTIGCHVGGSFPAADQRTIEEIFNKGVRFWNQDHTHIGDYSVNNAPT